jgi:nucleoside-diphosphate-sugar epimerase
MMAKVLMFNPEVVINCAGSRGDANFEDSFEANFAFPLQVAKELKDCLEKSGEMIRWIQLASYFEAQIAYGRSDPYSLHKATFRQHFKAEFLLTFEICNIYLPHIVGAQMKKSSLFHILGEAASGKIIKLDTSGEQYLPVLHINDCIEGILMAFREAPGDYYLPPVWYGPIRDLVKRFPSSQISNIQFNSDRKSSDSDFPRIQFSPSIQDWSPNVTLAKIVNDFSERKEK